MDPIENRPFRRPVNPTVDRLAAYSWRLILIGIVGWALLDILGRLRLVVFPVAIAVLLTVALNGPARGLRNRGVRPLAAAWAVFLAFLAAVVGLGFLVIPAIAGEFGDLGPTVEAAVEDIKTWIVEDSPFDVDRQRLDELQEQAKDRIGDAVRSSGSVVLESAVLVVEIVAGMLLALVITFFLLKDGEKIQAWALGHLPEERRELACRLSSRAWRTLGGYLRGSATLGLIEAIIIGVTMFFAGASLVGPVMLLTVIAAFVPLVGAVVAGVTAVLVTLVTAGFTPALIVGIVALVVQQLDNDLLAPYVFGKALQLHPLVILLSVTAGGALAGLAGAFMAVPLTAMVINVAAEARVAQNDEPVATAVGEKEEE